MNIVARTDILEAKLVRVEQSVPWGMVLEGAGKYAISIYQISPNSPASRIGLKRNDVITEIGDTPTEGMSQMNALELIGQYGLSIILTIERKATGSIPSNPVISGATSKPNLKAYQTYNMSSQQSPPQSPKYPQYTPTPVNHAPLSPVYQATSSSAIKRSDTVPPASRSYQTYNLNGAPETNRNKPQHNYNFESKNVRSFSVNKPSPSGYKSFSTQNSSDISSPVSPASPCTPPRDTGVQSRTFNVLRNMMENQASESTNETKMAAMTISSIVGKQETASSVAVEVSPATPVVKNGEQKAVSGVTFNSEAAHRRLRSGSSLCDFASVAVPVEPEIEVTEENGVTTTVVKRYNTDTGAITKTTTTRRPSTTSGLGALRQIEKNFGYQRAKRVSGEEEIPDETRRRTSVSHSTQASIDRDDVFAKPEVTCGSLLPKYASFDSNCSMRSVVPDVVSSQARKSDVPMRRQSSTGLLELRSIGKDLGMDMYQRRKSKVSAEPDIVPQPKLSPTDNRRQVLHDRYKGKQPDMATVFNGTQRTSGATATSAVNSVAHKRKDSNTGLDAFRAYEKELKKEDNNNNNNSNKEKDTGNKQNKEILLEMVREQDTHEPADLYNRMGVRRHSSANSSRVLV